jgi:hypothetical protein
MIVVWRKAKGRKDKTATGERARKSKKFRAGAEREKEPWLLATSLNKTQYLSKKVVKYMPRECRLRKAFEI